MLFPNAAKLAQGKTFAMSEGVVIQYVSWLRGVDLNHRPLGYESKKIIFFNNLQDAGGP